MKHLERSSAVALWLLAGQLRTCSEFELHCGLEGYYKMTDEIRQSTFKATYQFNYPLL